jgi:hypothetical protein
MLAMKHCTKCGRQYYDPSLKYCTEDGTPLTPQVDAEAATVKIPELTDLDIVMEISDHLKRLSVRLARIIHEGLGGEQGQSI